MRQLPVTAAFGHAMKSTIDNIGFAFFVSWPWILIRLPADVASNLYYITHPFEPGMVPPAEFWLVTMLVAILGVVSLASIAVNWHRYVLRDEVPVGWQRLRLDWDVWRYIGNILLIWLLVMGVYLALAIGIVIVVVIFAAITGGFAAGAVPQMPPALTFLIVVLAVAVVSLLAVMYARLSVKLPGVALGRRDYLMKSAWRDTAGNFWRFVGLGLLFGLVLIAAALVTGLAGFLIARGGGNIGASISIAIQVVVGWVLQILGITLLTSLYGFFAEKREF